MTPPTMTLAPSGIMAMASSTETVFMFERLGWLLGRPAAVDRQGNAPDLRGILGAQEKHCRRDLLGRGEVVRRLFLGEQLHSRRSRREIVLRRQIVDLPLHKRG